MILLMYILMIFLMPLALLTLNFLLSKKSHHDREKISPFECGFDPISNNRLPLSTQFFLISLIFLIFDIELTLLIPMVYLMKNFNLFMLFSLYIILMILLFGLYLEYLEQSIDWKM